MKCHVFEEKKGKYYCKECGIDSLAAEKEALIKYNTGIVYAYPKDKMVGGWANKLVNAYYGHEYRSNFGDLRQSVYWTFNNQSYYGVYYKDNSDIIRYRKIGGGE